jgi:putative ABC transport system permease protein
MFEPRDGPDAPMVAIINETFAREHFPNENPIGQRIAYDRVPDESSVWYEIIGIVGDQHQLSPTLPARAEAFENRRQDWSRTTWVVVQTTGDPTLALSTVRSVLRDVDPLIPIAQTRTLREVWRASMAREEFILTLLSVFGALALLLATVGVYAITAQAARSRTREVGIRMALGAAAGDVVALMLRQSFAVVAVGLGVGLVLALVAGRVLGSVLFGVAPSDPPTLLAVVLLFAAAAGTACWLPARRATTVDPVSSLRPE